MIVIKAGWLVNPGREPVKNPVIEIENGFIKSLKYSSGEASLVPANKNVKIIDLRNSIIIPGLINSHSHLDYSFLKNKTPKGDFIEWLKFIIKEKNEFDSKCSNQESSLRDCINKGITAFGDIFTNGLGLKSLKKVPGLKGIVFIEFIDTESNLTDKSINEKISSVKKKLKDTKIKIGIMAHAVYSVSSRSIKKLYSIALENNLPFSIHIAESVEESVLVKYGNGPLANLVKNNSLFGQGLSPVGYLNKLGCLNGTILVHAVNLERSDYDLISKFKNDVVLCPLSNRYLNTGKADYFLLKEAAGRISLATDSLASNTSLCLFAEARAAAQDFNLDYKECLRMITDYPGSVMGINALIEEGNQADLTILRPNKEIKDKADLLKVVFEDSNCILTIAGGNIISNEENTK